jgi:hypothetical protein
MAGIEHHQARAPADWVATTERLDRAIRPIGTRPRIVTGTAFLLLGLLLDGDGIDWSALLLGLAGLSAIVVLAQLARLSVTTTALRETGRVAACFNLALFDLLLALPWTSRPTFVFLGASMLLAARRGYAGCETLAIPNWLLRRNDQVGCVLFTPIDALETRLPAHDSPTTYREHRAERHAGHGQRALLTALIACELAGCAALVA